MSKKHQLRDLLLLLIPVVGVPDSGKPGALRGARHHRGRPVPGVDLALGEPLPDLIREPQASRILAIVERLGCEALLDNLEALFDPQPTQNCWCLPALGPPPAPGRWRW